MLGFCLAGRRDVSAGGSRRWDQWVQHLFFSQRPPQAGRGGCSVRVSAGRRRLTVGNADQFPSPKASCLPLPKSAAMGRGQGRGDKKGGNPPIQNLRAKARIRGGDPHNPRLPPRATDSRPILGEQKNHQEGNADQFPSPKAQRWGGARGEATKMAASRQQESLPKTNSTHIPYL